MFSYRWRAKLTKRKIFIKSSINLIKALKVDCNLTALSIKKHIPFILSVILLTIENEDCQTEIAIWQNLIIVSGKYVTLQQNNPRRPKRKWDSENKLFCMA